MSKIKKSKDPVQTGVALLKQGKNSSFITKHLLENNKDVTSIEEAKKVISEANEFIKSDYETDFKNIWLLHINRYKKEINRLLKTEELPESEVGRSITYEQFIASRNKKVSAYFKCMQTMKQLEDLYQITSDTSILELNEQININVDPPKDKWPNIDKLSFEELLELHELIQKAKKKDYEPQGVKEALLAPQNIIEDITHEVIEDVNLKQIKQVQIEPKPTTASNYINPNYKLREALKKLAAKSFKNAGSKLTEEEEGLIEN